ncbi:PREDICTED: proline-rich extensin-like protein EPR1 [Nicrophorus vespilloides]|uniref:Proline-rich extensin-like protein EPR1 n=1 Tax=Nicrophorus vespilloides TaxID=110193 RepID=A0ABM1N2M8_NICVS|nr:PREDICTED: proline-rich extensin-like protein EPR1 [Nicrophorus vespilloides]
MSRLASAFFLCSIVSAYSVPLPNATVFTSTYAKVAKWGTDTLKSSVGEGRSAGQTFFTQRSDASVRSGQNIKPKEVVYHYSMASDSRVGEDKNEQLPARGEVVIQDRFHPPPFFNYFVKNGHEHDHHQHSESKPSVVYASPADLQSDKPPSVDAQPSVDSYSSPLSSYGPVASGIPKDTKTPMMDSFDNPINSYNPPPSGPPDSKPKSPDSFPPNTPSFLDYNPSKGKPKFPGYVYDPPIPDSPMPSAPSMQKPANNKPKSPNTFPPNTPAFLDYDPSKGKPKFPGYVYDPPISDSPMPSAPSMSKLKPPSMAKFPGPLAPPPDDDDSKSHDYMPQPSGPDMDQGPPITQTVSPPSGSGYYNFDHDHHHHHHHPHSDDAKPDDSDLSPPPSGPPASFPKHIPEYLDHDPSNDYHYHHVPYNFDHHHHVYHEVKTTTTEAPVEDERVNKGHYSYYYLGRKLWYIPLYFSVYFIIYITILILKSIARHKVNFVHEYDKGKSRSFDTTIDDTERNVTTAINNFQRRYLAM